MYAYDLLWTTTLLLSFTLTITTEIYNCTLYIRIVVCALIAWVTRVLVFSGLLTIYVVLANSCGSFLCCVPYWFCGICWTYWNMTLFQQSFPDIIMWQFLTVTPIVACSGIATKATLKILLIDWLKLKLPSQRTILRLQRQERHLYTQVTGYNDDQCDDHSRGNDNMLWWTDDNIMFTSYLG